MLRPRKLPTVEKTSARSQLPRLVSRASPSRNRAFNTDSAGIHAASASDQNHHVRGLDAPRMAAPTTSLITADWSPAALMSETASHTPQTSQNAQGHAALQAAGISAGVGTTRGVPMARGCGRKTGTWGLWRGRVAIRSLWPPAQWRRRAMSGSSAGPEPGLRRGPGPTRSSLVPPWPAPGRTPAELVFLRVRESREWWTMDVPQPGSPRVTSGWTGARREPRGSAAVG